MGALYQGRFIIVRIFLFTSTGACNLGGGGGEGRVGRFRSGSLRYLRRTNLCILVHEKLLQVTKIPRLTYATYVLHFISSDTKFYDQ